MNNVTLEMLAMLPIWMKMKTDPENSQGALFLDSVGKQLYDIERLTDNILGSHHLNMSSIANGIDISSIDILYKVQIQKETIDYSADIYGTSNGANYPLTRCTTIYKFYEDDEVGVNKYYIDTETYTLYTKTRFDSITYNNALYTNIYTHSVWGPFDEIGLLLGCPRIYGEVNSAYKVRLLDVFHNPGNATRAGLKNFISRSLGINSTAIDIQELDEQFINSLINANGVTSLQLKEYMSLSNKVNLSTSNIYWEVLEENNLGLSYLPMLWNVSLEKWNNDSIQNGIGDIDDIEVIGPVHENINQNFNYHVGVEGLKVAKQKIYPQHNFKYRVFATGYKYDEGYKPENYKYSVIASELIPLRFNVKAYKNYTRSTNLEMDGSVVDYTTVTVEDKKLTSYISKNVVVIAGDKVMNPDNRYLEILGSLRTSNKANTPSIESITINYKNAAATQKKVIISGNSSPSVTGANEITTGFEINTWADSSPVLKVRSDINDQYRSEFITASSSMTLARGEYQKIFNSEGDWDDGQATNTKATVNGTLKLSI